VSIAILREYSARADTGARAHQCAADTAK